VETGKESGGRTRKERIVSFSAMTEVESGEKGGGGERGECGEREREGARGREKKKRGGGGMNVGENLTFRPTACSIKGTLFACVVKYISPH
jgi:hypothetical protein